MNPRSGSAGRDTSARGVDPLLKLRCIDRLTVGPVQLSSRRAVVPYEVTREGNTERTELIYRWEEDVFEPETPADLNLATLIGAQVALNYGLFCREIVFRGPLDRHDRRFLEDYAAHTAREIYAIKFLEANPFLGEEFRDLPWERRRTWLQARIVFEGRSPPKDGVQGWPSPDPTRHAVLSSGGKDSLLTFGLMRELGLQVHAIFVNESGRHWFTALNAYRHFVENVPHTARVWTNSDRVFAWMLRHLPFVRQDWHRQRADIYPVRLWTVAVFLFGALPLMRKRGIGSINIGSEHDTTVRSAHGGVVHYGGLYDQSRWFDNALTRYYQRKGWGLVQFSVLRSLSELLILKILVERYPELQAHQVSCHASHVSDQRMRPCGRCEKCRRIVGMLLALGAEPANCGYTQQQIDDCLRALASKGIHQESAGAEHLAHLLVENGLLPPSTPRREHPEILQVRVDPERSPHESVPRTLRRGLYQLFLSHAPGAVERHGRAWVSTNILASAAMARPYPFESASGAQFAATDDGEPLRRSEHELGRLTWPEAKRRLAEVDIALLPVGAIEQHGPHLPLDVDAYDAERLARDVAKHCSHPRPLVLPLIPYGVSYHHDDFPGTVSIGPDTLSRVVYEIGMSLARQGINKLVIINGHGGNGPALHFAAQMVNRDARIFTCVDTGETSDADIVELAETPNDVHAGEIETSTTMALRPELVQLELAESSVPRFSSHYLDFSSKRGIGWYGRTRPISASGVMGDPTRASPEKGKRMWEIMVRNLVELVEDIKSLTLEEIHQRRY